MYTLQSGYVYGSPYTFTEINDDTVPSYLWPGGYAAEYIAPDGGTLCGDCMRRAFLDDSLTDHDAAMAGQFAGPCEAHDESEERLGITCEGCNRWIVEPED